MSFDAPEDMNGTVPAAINGAGEIAGSYFDATLNSHAFLRERDGAITAFDPPWSIYTTATSINSEGVIAG